MGRWLKGNRLLLRSLSAFPTISLKSVGNFSNDLGPTVGRDKLTAEHRLPLLRTSLSYGGLQMWGSTTKHLEEATRQRTQTQTPPFLPPSLPVLFPPVVCVSSTVSTHLVGLITLAQPCQSTLKPLRWAVASTQQDLKWLHFL